MHKVIKPVLINKQSVVYKFECVMLAMLVTCSDTSTNKSMSIKDLDQYSITAKININQEQ